MNACSPYALITLGAEAYAGADAYARATRPPERIFPTPKDGYRVNKLTYADDPRIQYWCQECPRWAVQHADVCAEVQETKR